MQPCLPLEVALCSIRRLVGEVAHKSAFGGLPSGSRWLAPAVVLAVGLALIHGAVMALSIRNAVALNRSIGLLQAEPPNATPRLLLVSDSTEVATGARKADASVASLIARHHPNVCIVNRARVSAKFVDIVR